MIDGTGNTGKDGFDFIELIFACGVTRFCLYNLFHQCVQNFKKICSCIFKERCVFKVDSLNILTIVFIICT